MINPQFYNFDISKRWYIDFYKDGTRIREWIKSKPYNTREQRAKKRLDEIKNSFENFTINFFNIIDRMELRKKSKQTYKTDIKILIAFGVSGVCTVEQAKDFLMFLNSKYSKKTVKNKINNVKCVYQFAVDNEYIQENPFKKIATSGSSSDSDFNYPFSEYERSIIEPYLIEHNFRLYLFTRFIYYSFTRPNEIINLKVRDIDLRSMTIKISSESSKTGKALIKPITKNLLDLILDNKLLNYPSNFYLFGKLLNSGAVKCSVNYASSKHTEILKKLDLHRKNETVLYSWKHTGNINAYLAGLDIKVIQKINGHSSLQTTEIYLRRLGLFLDKTAFSIEF